MGWERLLSPTGVTILPRFQSWSGTGVPTEGDLHHISRCLRIRGPLVVRWPGGPPKEPIGQNIVLSALVTGLVRGHLPNFKMQYPLLNTACRHHSSGLPRGPVTWHIKSLYADYWFPFVTMWGFFVLSELQLPEKTSPRPYIQKQLLFCRVKGKRYWLLQS